MIQRIANHGIEPNNAKGSIIHHMKCRIKFGSLMLFAVALLLAIASAPYIKDYLEIRRCGKHLTAINQAARVWADAHNGRLPSSFLLISNELVSTRLLLCPGDKLREPADKWRALTSANTSYVIDEGALNLLEMLQNNSSLRWILTNRHYLGCKVHSGNSVGVLGEVAYDSPPLPVYLLGGLAIVAFLGSLVWHDYKAVQGQHLAGPAAGDLLPRIEQVRRDHLAARPMAPSQWFRKDLVAAARHALRALPFFRDRKSEPHVRENPRIT
jgi:hypothetical protein